MGLELFTRNLKYLFKYNLKHMWQKANTEHDDELISQVVALLQNERELNSDLKQPTVLDMEQTVTKLLTEQISFCRFGDGELALIHEREAGVFQRYDSRLADILKNALTSYDEKLCVGINYFFYHLPSNLHPAQDVFYRCQGLKYRHNLAHYIDPDQTYGDSLISMPYHLFLDYDFSGYFERIAQLWAGQEIVMICGKTVFNKIQHNIFDNAAHIEYIYGPRVNAFDEYDSLLQKALATDPKKTKFLILGQTATALAYDLAQHGHRALDIGHIAKDYNSWRLNEDLTKTEAIHNFYDKD